MYLLAAFLAVAGLFDFFFRKIPGRLILTMLVSCLILNLYQAGVSSLAVAVPRILIAGGLFYPFFVIGALGAGDVKLIAVSCGFVCGERALWFLFFSLLTASVIGTMKMGINGEIKKRMYRLALYIGKTIKTGRPEMYHANREAALKNGVALAGPMFVSALLGIGGLY
ncbi:MAG: A24 family peptidase [Lachnospiraceae bacterium]|nr:A24 family peptidase [Lachnospiraceae bacterium]